MKAKRRGTVASSMRVSFLLAKQLEVMDLDTKNPKLCIVVWGHG